MARLIVLNGPPAVGKSTIARRYVDEHPFALNLDLDNVMRLVGRWRDDPTRAGLLVRDMALAMAREHLRNGYDVVLPQYLGRPQFLEQAEAAAAESGARFCEFVLIDDRDEVLRRFTERTATTGDPLHLDAAHLVDVAGGADALVAMYDRLLRVLESRPAAQVIPCPEGRPDEVYQDLLARLG